jgi:pimeloyl-ACP methyl ester carboxylesterase
MRKAMIAVLASVGAILAPLGSAHAADVPAGVVEHPVTFRVVNSNSSGLPCPSDGLSYEIHGLLTGPRSAFEQGTPPPVSLYLHGFSFGGKWLWSFKAVDGYDWDGEMAKRGQVSLSIDRLGYEESGHPEGHLTCIGSAADQTHQIIQSLRRGDYNVQGGAPLKFDRIALVGHDTGGVVAEVEAYSYHDIDALVDWGWADQGFSQWAIDRVLDRTAFCLRGGEPAETGDPLTSTGYFWFPATDQEVRDAVGTYMDPAVLEAALKLHNRNPCGDLTSAVAAAEYHANTSVLGGIHVPVFLIYEDHDIILTKEGAEQQPAHFTGTDDLTWVMLQGAGHFPMLERRQNDYERMLVGWLDGHL